MRERERERERFCSPVQHNILERERERDFLSPVQHNILEREREIYFVALFSTTFLRERERERFCRADSLCDGLWFVVSMLVLTSRFPS